MVKTACQANSIEQKDYRFSRRDVREYTSWGNTQLKVHLGRLEEMEYLLTHRGRRGQSYEYELLFDGGGTDQAQVMGLIDAEKLRYDKKKSGQMIRSRPVVGPKSGVGRSRENRPSPVVIGSCRKVVGVTPKMY